MPRCPPQSDAPLAPANAARDPQYARPRRCGTSRAKPVVRPERSFLRVPWQRRDRSPESPETPRTAAAFRAEHPPPALYLDPGPVAPPCRPLSLCREESPAHLDSVLGEKSFKIAHGVGAVVKNGRRQSSVRAGEHFNEVFRLARASRRNHWNVRGITNGGGERTIEPGLHA